MAISDDEVKKVLSSYWEPIKWETSLATTSACITVTSPWKPYGEENLMYIYEAFLMDREEFTVKALGFVVGKDESNASAQLEIPAEDKPRLRKKDLELIFRQVGSFTPKEEQTVRIKK